MVHGTPNAQIVRFGPYQMDRRACELRHQGRRIPLQVQPFRVLEALVDRAGEVVTRTELRAEIWPATVYVDFDHGLNNAINRLRHALGDSADAPRFIETLPRVGYRFICPVDSQSDAPQRAAESRRFKVKLSVAAAAGLALAALGLSWIQTESSDRIGLDNRSLSAPLTSDAEAREAYVRGLALLERRDKEAVSRSIEYLRQATSLDQDFAEAYAALAEAYVTAGGPTLARSMAAEEAAPLALEAAENSVRLRPDLPDGHAALASVLDKLAPWSPENDEKVEAEYLEALSLGATSGRMHLFFGNFLSSRGRSDEAILQYRQALEREPVSPNINSRLGAELLAVGEIDSGMEFLLRTIELDPYQYNARVRLGWAYAGLGRLGEASHEFSLAEEISPSSLPSLAGLAFVTAMGGELEAAREMLDTILPMAEEIDDPFSIAIVYVGLRERDNSLKWLAEVARKSRNLHRRGPYGIASPLYDWLRNDPGFREVERIVLEQSGLRQPLALAN